MNFRQIFSLWLVAWAGLLGIALAAATYIDGGSPSSQELRTTVAGSGPDCPAPSMRYDDAMDARPRSAPVLANLTILGSGAGSQAMLLREGSRAEVHNTLIAGEFRKGCVDVDDPATANAGGIRFHNSVIDCDGAPAFVADPGESWDVAAVVAWQQGGNGKARVALEGLRPAEGSGLTHASAQPPAAEYVGAIGGSDWTRGWSGRPAADPPRARAGSR